MKEFIKKHIFLIRLIFSVLCLIAAHIVEFINKDLSLPVCLPLCIVGYIVIAYDLYIEAFEGIKEGEFFNEETLTIIASIAAMAIGEFHDGLTVAIFFQLGEHFEDFAMDQSKKSVESILALRPTIVHLLKNKDIIDVDPEEVKIGDIILVKPGENIPLDGEIIEGNSNLNTSSINGESLPIRCHKGDKVLSGFLNIDSIIKIKTVKEYSNSTVAQILDMIENADEKKTGTEKFITKFARVYTPIVISLAFSIALLPPLLIGFITNDWSTWSDWIYRAASTLVVACPCALIISIPMSYVVSIGVASKNKAIIKGSTYLEAIAKADTIFFDKTGTLTEGNFKISEIKNTQGVSKEDLLKYAQIGESFSNHPIAKAILESIDPNKYKDAIKDYQEFEGKGISCTYEGKKLLVGNDKLIDKATKTNDIGTIVHVSYDDNYLGYLIIKDTIKEGITNTISQFKKVGFKNISMLTGDSEEIAKDVANTIGLDNYKARLLPIDKTRIIEDAKANGQTTIFVGDGVNDAPSLIMSDVGISMGQIGSDSAIEASDVVIMDDNLNRIPFLKKLSKINKFVVLWNIYFSIIIKAAVLILNAFGVLGEFGIVAAIFADVGVTIICCITSLLINLYRPKIK